MKTGWICLHRKLIDNPIISKSKYLAVWIYLLLSVNGQENSFIWNNKKVTLKRGQGIVSQLEMSKVLKINISTINRILKYFENENQIGKQTTTKYTLITILNWYMYQDNGKWNRKQTKNKLKTNEKQTKTINNKDNKDNKDNIIPKGIIKQSFGNEDINTCMNIFKEKLGGSLDDSEKMNRRFCRLLLNRIKKDYPDKNPVNGVKALITVGLQDKFHGKNLTNMKYLFYNAQKIIQSYKKKDSKLIFIS